MIHHQPNGSADVSATTHEGHAVESTHDVMLGLVRVEIELDRGVVGELDGSNTHSL